MDIKKLIGEMTLEEKAEMCSGADFWHFQGNERLGIPPVMLTDGPCGVRKQEESADHLGLNKSVQAVSFPTGSCTACSFDKELLRESGEVLGNECLAEDVGVVLGPAANIKRSPLCGRNFEYFSEDPYLAGELAAAFIKGVQSRNIGTSIKHFAANSQEHRRLTSDSNLDERTLREIYLPAFEKAVKEAQPWTVMCSYNKINGKYASENQRLLTEILRDEWGFEGMTVSDWGAVNDRVEGVDAGLDLEMPGGSPVNAKHIEEAVKNGRLSEKTLETTVERILKTMYKYLEHKPGQKPAFDYEKDHEAARRLAYESMGLLKNDDAILPADTKKKIAFVGEFADRPRFQGGGSSHVNSYRVDSSVEAARKLGADVVYAQGYDTSRDDCDEALMAEAAGAAAGADCAVVFVGIPDRLESEGFDRENLSIPENELEIIKRVTAVQKNTAVVVECGGCIEMPFIDDVKAVLYAYLGGEAVGAAVCDIIFGEVNPSGKLAETFPKKLEDNPSYLYYTGEGDRVEYREGVFVGYRYYDKKKIDVLFPFGFGLSYTSFEYSGLQLDKKELTDGTMLTAKLKVKNTGTRAGKEIVELYVKSLGSSVIRPEKELKGFEKVELAPGEGKTVSFTLDMRSFAYYDTDMRDWYAESGDYEVLVGKSSLDIELCEKVSFRASKEKKIVYTKNSTMGDLQLTEKGRAALDGVLESMGMKEAGDGLTGSAEATMKMMLDFPLRSVVGFSAGRFTPQQLDNLLENLNK